jgi:hypothetical protein
MEEVRALLQHQNEMNWHCVHNNKPKKGTRVAADGASTRRGQTFLEERNVQLNINRWPLSIAI